MFSVSGDEVLWHWFDSIGYPPEVPARGGFEGDALVLERTSPRGTNRTTFRDGDRSAGVASTVPCRGLVSREGTSTAPWEAGVAVPVRLAAGPLGAGYPGQCMLGYRR